jgi:vancomycin resistance protein YoaR
VPWLGLAGALGLALGLSLLAAGATGPENPRGLVHRGSRTAEPVTTPDAGAKNAAWFDLELPEGQRRRVLRTEVMPAMVTLLALKEELDRAPVDARVDFDHQAISSEQHGRRLDVDASLAAIERALSTGSDRATVIFGSVAPERRASDVRGVAHEVVLGSFETRFERADGAREHTLGLLARALDGRVILPGEVFSFNAAVGPRGDTHGYPIAAAAALGELVDGVGSFSSQIASTLHAAAIFAGLEVLERHPHPGPRPVIELGLEAAVAFPSLDLRLRNPYDFPIVLRLIIEDGRTRAEVRGRRRPHAISLVRRVERATPFSTIERADATLPLGERFLAQRGVPGLELLWHRVRRDGAHAVRQTTRERYAPTPEIVRVGTGSTSLAALGTGRPQREPAPEYLPNELLVMTQGDGGDAALTVQRVPGRFGTPGWTKDVGAPAWFSPAETAVRGLSAADSADFFTR